MTSDNAKLIGRINAAIAGSRIGPHDALLADCRAALSLPAPQVAVAELKIEYAMTNPPKPIGVGVFAEGKLIAVATLDNLRQVCTALPAPQGHPNVLREETTDWRSDSWTAESGAGVVTCHSRVVGGVLCRWWGDGETPAGVATIDAAAAPQGAVEALQFAAQHIYCLDPDRCTGTCSNCRAVAKIDAALSAAPTDGQTDGWSLADLKRNTDAPPAAPSQGKYRREDVAPDRRCVVEGCPYTTTIPQSEYCAAHATYTEHSNAGWGINQPVHYSVVAGHTPAAPSQGERKHKAFENVSLEEFDKRIACAECTTPQECKDDFCRKGYTLFYNCTVTYDQVRDCKIVGNTIEPSPQTPEETEVANALKSLRHGLEWDSPDSEWQLGLANLIERQQARIAELERAAVPREPTVAMIQAAGPINNFDQMNYNVWRAMWDAAMRAERGKA